MDAAGDLFIGTSGSSAIWVVLAGCTSAACQTALGSGLEYPSAVAVDSAGDLFLAEEGLSAVIELNRSQAPSLNFPTATRVGTTDITDGTETVRVLNIGNAPVAFSSVTYPTDFSPGADTTPCASSTVLAAGQECDVPVVFTPALS